MFGYIYLTTNLLNGKIYIGQHKSNSIDESYYGSGKYLKNAINKYGLENFNTVIIKECESKEELDFWEIFYIKEYQSQNSEIGYNITSGGYGCRDYIFTEEDRKKIGEKSRKNNLARDHSIYDAVSEKHKGNKMMTNGTINKWVSESDINEMLEKGWKFGSCKKRNRDYKNTSGKNNGMYGKSAVKGRVWIHRYINNQLERLYIKKDELDKYITNGWEYGMK